MILTDSDTSDGDSVISVTLEAAKDANGEHDGMNLITMDCL